MSDLEKVQRKAGGMVLVSDPGGKEAGEVDRAQVADPGGKEAGEVEGARAVDPGGKEVGEVE